LIDWKWIYNQLIIDSLIAIGTIGSAIGAVVITVYSFKIGRSNEKNKGLRYISIIRGECP
jgi:hypothetical protein